MACSWVNENCTHSIVGRRFSCLFVGLLMSTKKWTQAEWIATYLNFIANDISRLKTESEDGEFDYAELKLTYPLPEPCRQFQPSDIILVMIWDILFHKSCPHSLSLRQSKPSALKQFISYSY